MRLRAVRKRLQKAATSPFRRWNSTQYLFFSASTVNTRTTNGVLPPQLRS